MIIIKIIELYLGSYEILDDEGKKIGSIVDENDRFKVEKGGKHIGYIGLKEIIQTYNAYNEEGKVIGEGKFENMLSVFF